MELKLFGISREIVGDRTLTIDASQNIQNVASLKSWLAERYPEIQQLKSFAVAVDNEYAEDDRVLTAQNEVAIIPPVSGG